MMGSDEFTGRPASLSPVKWALLELKQQQGRCGIAANVTIPRRATQGSAPLYFA